MYSARLRPLGLFLAASWDLASTGATSQNTFNEVSQGQPYDLAMFDNVNQWTIALGRRMDPDQQRATLARGGLVFNGGIYFIYRNQYLSGERFNTIMAGSGSYGVTTYGMGLVPRNANLFVPDLWFQVLGPNFRIEGEAVYVGGSMSNGAITTSERNPLTVSQFGAALETEFRLLNNRLRLEFRTGFATGDAEMEGLNFFSGLQGQRNNDTTLSLFRFHPDYRIDLIFWRQIMRQFSGAYYFRPSVQYNFIDEPGGDLFFGRVDAIWSRASEFVQTRGNQADLGIELDATLQYQTHHLSPNAPNPRLPHPGFYAMLQYGVFFPMGGLGPTTVERSSCNASGSIGCFNFQTAQTVRAYLGVSF